MSFSRSRNSPGTPLLPKIRPQDIVIEPLSAGGPVRHRRVLSSTFVPYPPPMSHRRNSQSLTASAPSSASSFFFSGAASSSSSCSSSCSPAPITTTATSAASSSSSTSSASQQLTGRAPPAAIRGHHSRSGSASSIDEATLSRYGYPTYRQLPQFISSQATPSSVPAPASLSATRSATRSENAALISRSPTLSPSLSPSPFPYTDMPQSALVQLSSSQLSPTLSIKYSDELVAQQPVPQPLLPLLAPDTTTTTTTTLAKYLTAPLQAINLVQNVSVVPTRGLHDYFWWDIRNLRSWNTFSLPTFNSIEGLAKLLNTEIISTLLAPPAASTSAIPASRLSPESETALVGLIHDLYGTRVNAALAVSQGADHLSLYPAPDLVHTPFTVATKSSSTGKGRSKSKNCGRPHFLANYSSDTECTGSGFPRGRLVGVVKSFDRWNTGMRNEAPHRRVEYLNGLAHLQRCMREHSCRYGFIMTEIELVCVRAGCADYGDGRNGGDSGAYAVAGHSVPYFGFLEVAPSIPTKTAFSDCDGCSQLQSPLSASSWSSRSASPTSSPEQCNHSASHSETDVLDIPMTASLALYFLAMLSKSVPLPNQPSGYLDVGGPGALTRQRILPEGKDTWIPEPQIGERRDAKRVRGWVWPQDPWHRREGGRRGIHLGHRA